MSNPSKIEKTGRIIAGEYAGFDVKIQDVRNEGGGILILVTKSDIGYDYWTENEEGLALFFSQADWVIEWNAA